MFEAILSPFRWLMSWLLGAFHSILEFAGLPADSGWTWALSILLLVVLIRTLLIINPGHLNRIASITQPKEFYPFNYASCFNI